MKDILWIKKKARLYEHLGFTRSDSVRLATQAWYHQFTF